MKAIYLLSVHVDKLIIILERPYRWKFLMYHILLFLDHYLEFNHNDRNYDNFSWSTKTSTQMEGMCLISLQWGGVFRIRGGY